MGMMNRQNWKFPYTAEVLCEAARKKVDYHKSRVTWWTDKQAETLAKIKESGIEVDTSLANLVSNTYSRGMSVSINDVLQRDMQECVGKIVEHRAKVEDYSAWVEVLESQGKAHFDLHQEDWLFFFAKIG